MRQGISVTVVILNWNGAETIRRCAESIIHQLDNRDELILVDNGSTDGSIQELLRISQEAAKPVQLIQNRTNLGFSGGMNAGFRCAQKSLVVFANQDIIFAPDFISRLRKVVVRHADVAMFSPAIYIYGTGFSQEKRGESGVSGFGLFYRPHFVPTGGKPRRSILAHGCCIIGRVADLNALCIGGQLFEEAFHSGYEDEDLFFRLFNRKKQLFHIPELRVEHLGSGSVGNRQRIFEKPDWYQRQLYRNRWLWVLLNEKLTKLIVRAPIFISFELLVLIYLVLFHRRSVSLYIRGVTDSFSALRSISRRRKLLPKG